MRGWYFPESPQLRHDLPVVETPSTVEIQNMGTSRVAVVNWKTLYVWALNPSELIQDNHTGFYPSSWETNTSSATRSCHRRSMRGWYFPESPQLRHDLPVVETRGRRFDDWQIMAQLGGFREIPTSHGSPVATSRRGV
jgi:hypothetical protein